jgi:hypothetical protein
MKHSASETKDQKGWRFVARQVASTSQKAFAEWNASSAPSPARSKQLLQYLSFFGDFVKVMPGDLVAPLIPSVFGLIITPDGSVCSDLQSQPLICITTLRVMQNIIDSEFVHIHLPSKLDTVVSMLEFAICVMGALGGTPNKDLCMELLPFVQSAMRAIQVDRPEVCASALASVVSATSTIFLSEASDLHAVAAKNMEQLFKAVVTEELIEKTMTAPKPVKGKKGKRASKGGIGKVQWLESIATDVKGMLQYRYNTAWGQVLNVSGALFTVCGKHSKVYLFSLLKTVVELKEAIESMVTDDDAGTAEGSMLGALNKTVGKAIEAMGPEDFLTVMPFEGGNDESFKISEDGLHSTVGVSWKRLWLLPLLVEHSKKCASSLNFFFTYVLGRAKLCEQAAREADAATPPNALHAKLHRTQSMHLWKLFPSFCKCPTDLPTMMATCLPTMKGALSDEKHTVLHLTICAGIKALVDFALAEDFESGGQSPPSLMAMEAAMPQLVPAVFSCFERLHRKDSNK